MIEIISNLTQVRRQIAAAAAKAGRAPDTVQLVAVTKNVSVERIRAAIAAGVTAIGENRVQEALRKYPHIGRDVEWHLIGHLQTNKVKYVAPIFDLIHSLDRMNLAQALSDASQKTGKTFRVLVQVNVAREETKYGITPEQAVSFVRDVVRLPGIAVEGLMTMAPYTPDAESVRPIFRQLWALREEITGAIPGVALKHLSMGMTGDFTVAVEEGATIVRIGTGIFGQRDTSPEEVLNHEQKTS